MATRQRDPVRERVWRKRVASWQSSGVTIRVYCARHGLAESAFHFWRRELRARDAAAPSRATKSTVSSPRPTFVPVTVLPQREPARASEPTLPAGTIEVRCPSGHLVTMPVGDAMTLRHLFAALAQPLAADEEVCPC